MSSLRQNFTEIVARRVGTSPGLTRGQGCLGRGLRGSSLGGRRGTGTGGAGPRSEPPAPTALGQQRRLFKAPPCGRPSGCGPGWPTCRAASGSSGRSASGAAAPPPAPPAGPWVEVGVRAGGWGRPGPRSGGYRAGSWPGFHHCRAWGQVGARGHPLGLGEELVPGLQDPGVGLRVPG